MIREILLADALDFTGFPESKIHDATAYPADETRRIGQVDEPVENDRSGVGDVEVCKCAEKRTGSDGSVWAEKILAAIDHRRWTRRQHTLHSSCML